MLCNVNFIGQHKRSSAELQIIKQKNVRKRPKRQTSKTTKETTCDTTAIQEKFEIDAFKN
jgi:hypothetical protein